MVSAPCAESYVEGYSLVDMGAEGQPMVYVSLGWEAITGFTMEEAAGKHCGRLLQVEDELRGRLVGCGVEMVRCCFRGGGCRN